MVRSGLILVPLLAASAGAVAGDVPPEALVQRMTAEFSYAIRNRLADRDGFWFATYELRGHAFPNDVPDRALGLACIGAAWGFDDQLGGEETVCRLGDELGTLFGRARQAGGTAGATLLQLDLYGGRGEYRGYAGLGTIDRAMDLSGERPSGRGEMTLRLSLVPAINEGE